MAKLEAEVDPTGSLAPDVRARRARLALRRDMARLSYLAAAKRAHQNGPEAAA